VKLIIDLTIKKNTSTDRKALLNLKDHPLLGRGVEVVYIYSLADEQINYPLTSGETIYIGEAQRVVDPTGYRFTHIAASVSKGGDFNINYTLTQYYHLNKFINLKIYQVKDRKKIEEELIKYHLYKYGAIPLGNGVTGGGYTPTKINGLKDLFVQYDNINVF
jgi:hypothetical protein